MKQSYSKRLEALEAYAPDPRLAGQFSIAEIEALSDDELDARLDEVVGPELADLLRRLTPREVDALLGEDWR